MNRIAIVLAGGLVLAGCHASRLAGPTPAAGPADASYLLSGTVLDSSGDVGLEGARIGLVDGDIHRLAVTDAGGRFAVEGLSAGSWMLTISKAGYIESRRFLDVHADRAMTLRLIRAGGLDRRPPRLP